MKRSYFKQPMMKMKVIMSIIAPVFDSTVFPVIKKHYILEKPTDRLKTWTNAHLEGSKEGNIVFFQSYVARGFVPNTGLYHHVIQT